MADHPDPMVWWKHRRRMAYTSLFSLLFITAIVINVELSDNAAKVLDTLIWIFGLIVGGYIGAATWDDIKQGRK